MGVGSWVTVLAFLAALVLLVVWIVLPFAVMGTKDLLRDLLREAKRTNQLLEAAQQRPGAALQDERRQA